mmetsp:Transcript_28421/g.71389  ORF Transcript_28421/g.71389 Transcript_28421/m.71389 type:complete len:257 (+) Transcript_28421:1341-2111(+)
MRAAFLVRRPSRSRCLRSSSQSGGGSSRAASGEAERRGEEGADGEEGGDSSKLTARKLTERGELAPSLASAAAAPNDARVGAGELDTMLTGGEVVNRAGVPWAQDAGALRLAAVVSPGIEAKGAADSTGGSGEDDGEETAEGRADSGSGSGESDGEEIVVAEAAADGVVVGEQLSWLAGKSLGTLSPAAAAAAAPPQPRSRSPPPSPSLLFTDETEEGPTEAATDTSDGAVGIGEEARLTTGERESGEPQSGEERA